MIFFRSSGSRQTPLDPRPFFSRHGLHPSGVFVDLAGQKRFTISSYAILSIRKRGFNVFNHTNFQGFNSNDVLAALGLSVNAATGAPKPDFFSCTSCQRPDGTYVGSGWQRLHLSDLQHGKLSKDLLKPVFGGIGDPATADIPRTLQLSFHVRF